MNLIINELTRGVELGAGLGLEIEDVGAFDDAAAVDVRGDESVGDGRALEACDEAQFADGGLGGDALEEG